MLKLHGVTKRYEGTTILDNIDLTIEQQKIICVLGPSGAGKSTLLNILSQAEPIDAGAITLQAELRISYVFQEDRLLPWSTVMENIAFVKGDAVQEDIQALLNEVGLANYHDHYPDQLSGGMRQRCSIARAFYYGGNLLLMDEPFHSLDYHLRFELVQQLISLWERSRCSIVLVTHDIDEALLLGNEIIILSKNPGMIAHRYTIPTPQRNRSLKEPELLQLRADILECLLSV
ncbi:ABC transporter ATP-binding protein [Paenibacillus massiliensis]|uniref:ABC transporter ATP-binding protein n=1 Tax=Paenibacillus massiliensis TaxID=225917 RepID=UPI00037FCB27|nr:ABC transporter ATP-binding protein [Paenibacillus massiliensis]